MVRQAVVQAQGSWTGEGGAAPIDFSDDVWSGEAGRAPGLAMLSDAEKTFIEQSWRRTQGSKDSRPLGAVSQGRSTATSAVAKLKGEVNWLGHRYANNQVQPRMSVDSRQNEARFADVIQKAASSYDLDERLLRAVIRVESGFNPRAVSPVGAQGMMQLMPGTARDLGVTDAFDPEQNIMAGARYLRQLLNRYQGEQNLALAAYNWGMGNLERNPQAMPAETRNYVAKINSILGSQGGVTS
ncbi:MAG: lytic transglycosylase domain-containing protein [Magnetococcales bacterium]|nr:lytic transglycosylase domain-containing protein [Magnetococcales bacterium]